jgi:ABC-2 type transport system ATP-binding protein
MPEDACDLRAVDVTKRYPGFSLEGVTFKVPRGSIVGLVGQNGAGKTTLMRALLGSVRVDAGHVELFGQDPCALGGPQRAARRAQVGYVGAICSYPPTMTVAQVAHMSALAFPRFDQEVFEGLCRRLGLTGGGKGSRSVKELSRGMGMKLQLCCSLAAGVDLLVLDEPTSGLDPIVRDEVLDVIRVWMEAEGRSALISSHITSDLEKIADYVVMLDAGRVVLSCARDVIDDEMGVARLRAAELDRVLAEGRVTAPGHARVLRRELSLDLLVGDRAAFTHAYPDYVCDRATIDDVMALMIKGEMR